MTAKALRSHFARPRYAQIFLEDYVDCVKKQTTGVSSNHTLIMVSKGNAVVDSQKAAKDFNGWV